MDEFEEIVISEGNISSREIFGDGNTITVKSGETLDNAYIPLSAVSLTFDPQVPLPDNITISHNTTVQDIIDVDEADRKEKKVLSTNCTNNSNCDIFLSHSSLDYMSVATLRNALETAGCRPLMFHLKCLEYSDDEEIFDLLKREIDAREWFILCQSENSKKSKWVTKEMEYVKKHKAPIILDIQNESINIKHLLEILKKNADICLVYPKNLSATLEELKKILSYNYNIKEIIYKTDVLEVLPFLNTNCDLFGNLLFFVDKASCNTLALLLNFSDNQSCIFIKSDDDKINPRTLMDTSVFLLDFEKKNWCQNVSQALRCLNIKNRIAISQKNNYNYKKICGLYHQLGDLYESYGYLAKAIGCFSHAHYIAQENSDEELSNFYFINFLEELRYELRNSSPFFILDYLRTSNQAPCSIK